MTKRFILTLILLGVSIILFGQNMSVKEFYLSQTDLTANTPGTMVNDQNGNVCALIKVETTLDGFSFDVGSLGVAEVKRVGGEIWVYVPFGIRKITISHSQLGVIRDYALKTSIEKGRTYILKLNASLGNRIYDSSKKQQIILQVFPPNANLEINGISMPLNENGICEHEFSFGIYELVLSAPKYHPVRTQIEINDHKNVQKFDIRLKQAFGWLEIDGDSDETLYIDGEYTKYTPQRRIELLSGHYRLSMQKPLHKSYEATVEIKDSTVSRIKPHFVENYKELELKVYNDADIYIDDVKVATGSWKGKLEYGEHRIECRKESHRSTELRLDVNQYTLGPIVLENPEPIYASLAATSNPSGAKLYINGEYKGITPLYIPKMLIGKHSISVDAPNGEYQTQNVTLNEDDEVVVSFDTSTNKTSVNQNHNMTYSTGKQFVKFDITPEDAVLEISGEGKETSNGIYEELLPWGKYHYRVIHDMYHELQGVIEVNDASNIHTVCVTLKPAFGYLTVSTEKQSEIAGASVFIDDSLVGTIPLMNAKILSGTHNIQITKDKYSSYNTTCTFIDNEEITLSPTLAPITGSLTVSTKPSNAKVYIDDKFVGTSTRHIKELLIGSHAVNVRLDGYYSQTKNIFINENRDTLISFSLRKQPLTPAQYDKKYRNWGVVNSVDFNYSFPNYSSQIVYQNMGIRNFKCLHPIEFTYSIGYRFNNWISVSAGTGITHELVDLRNRGDVFADVYYENNIDEIVNYSTNIVPLYANSKCYLSRTKYQPMLSVSIGTYIVPKVKGLFLFDVGAGVNYRINRILNCYAMLSVGTAPILKGSVDVHSYEIILSRGTAWTPRIKFGITL